MPSMHMGELVRRYDLAELKSSDLVNAVISGFTAIFAFIMIILNLSSGLSTGNIIFIGLNSFSIVAFIYNIYLYRGRNLAVYRNGIEYKKTPFNVMTIEFAEVSEIEKESRRYPIIGKDSNKIHFEMYNTKDKEIKLNFLEHHQFKNIFDTIKKTWDGEVRNGPVR